MRQKGSRYDSSYFQSEFRQVWSRLPADKKQLVSEVVLCLCGLGD